MNIWGEGALIKVRTTKGEWREKLYFQWKNIKTLLRKKTRDKEIKRTRVQLFPKILYFPYDFPLEEDYKTFYSTLPESISVSCNWGKKSSYQKKKHHFMKYFLICVRFLESQTEKLKWKKKNGIEGKSL